MPLAVGPHSLSLSVLIKIILYNTLLQVCVCDCKLIKVVISGTRIIIYYIMLYTTVDSMYASAGYDYLTCHKNSHNIAIIYYTVCTCSCLSLMLLPLITVLYCMYVCTHSAQWRL